MGWAAVWIDLAQINASAYHLHYLYNNQSFPPIEYINNNWYYLNWDNRRYYTKPRSQIDTPMSFSLGTHLTPSIEAVFQETELDDTSNLSQQSNNLSAFRTEVRLVLT